MTRDEVMAMTDEELRIKAAELRGWEYYCRASDITGHDDRGLCGNPPGGWTDANGEREDCLYELPDYPNDIAAAWELTKFEHKTWSFLARLLDERPGHDRYMIYNVMLKTTPQEIVRAFILAMADKEATD